MDKKYHRKEFLRLAFLANLGLYIKPLGLINNSDKKLFFSPETPNVFYYKKGDSEYDNLRRGFNKRINKFPQVIALCMNTAGVSEAMKYAITNKLPVAIKSGGHCMEGFSSNEGGMVINLSRLNKIEWLGNDEVNIGPGCTLSKLYETLLPKGKLISGGSCGSVGMGGLTLGGGYGLLSRKYGLTCDSLQEVTMVDGKGNIRSSKDDKELLWACKGGGNGNFGVITELKFKTHTAPKTLESLRIRFHNVTSLKAKSILESWFAATENLPVSCFSAFILNGKTIYILITNCDKHNAAVQSCLDKISAGADKITHSHPQALAGALKVFYGQKGPLYLKNASAGLYKNFNTIRGYIDQVLEKVILTPGMIYQINTLGGKIMDKEFEKASAFAHRSDKYFSELQTYWKDPKQESHFIERFEQVQNIFYKNGINSQYRNYPDINFKQPNALYYGSNYARLQQVKNKYDPNNNIKHEQSIQNS